MTSKSNKNHYTANLTKEIELESFDYIGDQLPKSSHLGSINKFRLFISSTFSDFVDEREILQTQVFPEIESYCATHGYQFQAIDLRWGVHEEAQLDQRTIQICLNEVDICKSYVDPNFLIMIGDRYGWIPVPYMIEENKFDTLKTFIKKRLDRKILSRWYSLDENNIPPTYFLKRRMGKFEQYKQWSHIEDRLREIFQSALRLDKNAIQNSQEFFTSATELEIESGLEGYLQLNSSSYFDLNKTDNLNKFAFLRTIDCNPLLSGPIYTNEDLIKTQQIKEKLKRLLPDNNILDAKSTRLINNIDLDSFKEEVTNFLKRTVNLRINLTKQQLPEELESRAQQRYLHHKSQGFVGRINDTTRIESYLSSNQQHPLFITGKSGFGKSSLMAKVINDAIAQKKNVIYQFIGATPQSSNAWELLRTVLFHLGATEFLNASTKISYKDLSQKTSQLLQETDKDIYIFVDAIDQLSQADHLYWIPTELAPRIKVVISILNDIRYPVSSKTYQNVKKRFPLNFFYQLQIFDNVEALIEGSLKALNRKLNNTQQAYALTKLEHSSPLHITLCSQAMARWTSQDKPINLKIPQDQLNAVKQLIIDLHEREYHHKALIERIFSYLYLSIEGMSESELIEILSYDQDFINIVAPQTYHRNLRALLPFSLWARLYASCQKFFIQREYKGFEILQLGHREFKSAVEELYDLERHSESFICSLLLSIERWQKISFDNTRVGYLFADVMIEHQRVYANNIFLRVICIKITLLESRNWLNNLINHLFTLASEYDYHFDPRAHAAYQILNAIYAKLPNNERVPELLADFYFRSGGYQYLHISWPLALRSLKTSEKYFCQYLASIDLPQAQIIKTNGDLSQTLGRIGEMYVRASKRYVVLQDNSSEQQVERKIQKALAYYERSEPMLINMYNEQPNDIERARKLGVLYERFAVAYTVIKNIPKARHYYARSLKFKGKSFIKESGENAFAMRKIWIIMAKFHDSQGKREKAKSYVLRGLKLTSDDDFNKAILTQNQYEIEQYKKLYSLAVAFFDSQEYTDKLQEIKNYHKDRALESEY